MKVTTTQANRLREIVKENANSTDLIKALDHLIEVNESVERFVRDAKRDLRGIHMMNDIPTEYPLSHAEQTLLKTRLTIGPHAHRLIYEKYSK